MNGMGRIACLLFSALLLGLALVNPSAANILWAPADPDSILAYRVGSGVITIASESLLSCEAIKLVPEAKPFVYDFSAGRPGGVMCIQKATAKITAYYEAGAPAKVTVKTKSSTLTVPVLPAPPALPAPNPTRSH